MAIVRHLAPSPLEIEAKHSEAAATYSLVKDGDGQRYLQIDTYGSKQRKLIGKKSQSIRFSDSAIADLKQILAKDW